MGEKQRLAKNRNDGAVEFLTGALPPRHSREEKGGGKEHRRKRRRQTQPRLVLGLQIIETDADGASEASRQEKEKRWRLLAGSPQFQRRDWGTVEGHHSVVVSCSPVCTRNTKGPNEDRADSSMRIMHVVYTPALRARRELNAYTASDRQGRSKTEQANNVKVRPTPSVQRQRGKIDTS